jgi:C4-dicarboxylate transporter, DctM subunit
MNRMLETILLGIALILLALLGAPLFIVIAAIAMLSFQASGIDTIAVIFSLYELSDASTLIAIPLFTFAGYMLAESNAPTRLVGVARSLFGWMPGGLAVVALFSCAFFTAFTGASGITIVALGGILMPVMIKERYSRNFSLGLMTSSGSLGLLFPPSLPIILYGFVAGVSIDHLFLAGVFPGLLIIALLSVYNAYKGIQFEVPRTVFSVRSVLTSFRNAAWELPLPLIILVGIYGGFITVVEAAAVTAFYVVIVEVLIYRDVKLRKLPAVMRESMVLVGAILVILGTAMGLTNYLIDEQVPMKLFAYIDQYVDSRIVFLILLNVFLLIVGAMMDIFSAIIVVVPLIIPIAQEFGIHPVHLGIIFLANLEIGYFTPPVGINLFISSYRFKETVIQLYRATFPFLLIYLAALLIITYIPELSLFLVRLFGGG